MPPLGPHPVEPAPSRTAHPLDQLPAWLIFCVEPTDRALTGWCPLADRENFTPQLAELYLNQALYRGTALFGRSAI